MTVTELRSLVSPVTAVAADEVPPALLERAAAYNEAVASFGEAIRKALGILNRGGSLDPDLVVALRTCAADLVTAREWLLTRARLPSSARLEAPAPAPGHLRPLPRPATGPGGREPDPEG